MYTYQHLEALILDWAGTVVDFGSFAPTRVLLDVFASVGVPVTLAEARVPMGLAKWDHIQALGRLPGVAERWRPPARRGGTLAGALWPAHAGQRRRRAVRPVHATAGGAGGRVLGRHPRRVCHCG